MPSFFPASGMSSARASDAAPTMSSASVATVAVRAKGMRSGCAYAWPTMLQVTFS